MCFVFSAKPKSLSLCKKREGEIEIEKESFFLSILKDKTGDYLRKKRAIKAWKSTIQFRPVGTCIMSRKMHCNLQEMSNDGPKVSEARKDSQSTIHRQQNKFTSLADCQESSLSKISSDSRCAIISILNFEPDGTWRIVALPVQCYSHVNLASGVNMEGLQLFPRPRYSYSAKSCTKQGYTSSNVHRRCQNKIANRASKLNELPDNSCSQSSLVCSPGLFSDSSTAVNSSVKYTSHSQEDDKSLKKNSRKRTRKKVRRTKKKSSDSGSPEHEVLTKEYVSVSLTSETCGINDVDKEGVTEFSTSDDRLVKSDSERNGNIDLMEAPNSYNSYLDQAVMSKTTAPIVQSSAGECATFVSKNQLKNRGLDFAVIDREIKDIQHDEPCSVNDIQESLVLDSVSVGSGIDNESINADDIGKRSIKANCTTTSDSGDGYFLGHNLTNGNHNDFEHIEGHGGKICSSNDKRVKQKRTMSKSSSFNKFGAVLHGRKGKENGHSVWQKVQKSSSDECGVDLKKVNATLSQPASTVEKDPSVIKECNSVSVNGVSKSEGKKQVKKKVGRKSKGKLDSVSKNGHSNYSKKSIQFNKSLSNDQEKVSPQQNDMLHISSQEINQQGLNTVTGFNSDIICQMDGVQTNGVEQVTSEIVNSTQFHPEESDPQKGASCTIVDTNNANIDIQDSTLVMPGENVNQSTVCEEPSPMSCNLEGDEVDPTVKEVPSADYNAQNHSSVSSLWKWIPVGKKDTELEKPECNSSPPEYSDASSSNNSNSESSVEQEVASSENQNYSLNASGTCSDHSDEKVSCVDGGESNKLGSPVVSKLTVHRDEHDVANHMFYECENQDMLENDSNRIAQAVNNACRAQLACETVHLATGGPIAEFEKLLHFCSPVICKSLDSYLCSICSHKHACGISLCRHEIPSLSLGCLWQWYEKHGSYGLEIRAQDQENPKKQGGVGDFPFRAYFVPSLSAVQLFKNHQNQRVNSSAKLPNFEDSDACEVDISENSSTGSPHSIFSVLFPRPRNQTANNETPKDTTCTKNASIPSINSTGDLQLLFEYFELEQPQQRQPLYEKIQELVRGNISVQSRTYGDPTKLDSIKMRDLHPSSWFSVAWYPIYRIPDGNFRASFLTYHSLGHLVRRRTSSDLTTVGSCIVSPTVGLQSYNAQGECWFQLNPSALTAEMVGLDPFFLLKERLRTLEETASLMARAVVSKDNITCTNRHPDYEFFLSRRRY